MLQIKRFTSVETIRGYTKTDILKTGKRHEWTSERSFPPVGPPIDAGDWRQASGALAGLGKSAIGFRNWNAGFQPNPDNFFNGMIDDVRIYNRALSPDEIKRLYNMGR